MDSDSIAGYFVYRSRNQAGPFVRLNQRVVTGLSYIDTAAPGGENYYTLRAVKLQTSPSGSYFTTVKEINFPVVNIISGIAEDNISFKNISIQPNPAREFTQISFTGTGFEKADIEILDVAGRNVVKLFSGISNAGENSLEWNLSDEKGARVPAGVYLLKITIGQQTTTQKIVVMP